MNKTCVALLAAALFATGVSPCLAEDGDGGQAGAYLKLGVGARALGQGGAFTAVADDATTIFWNPAGLSKLEQFEATGMHANLSLDRNYNFLGYGGPLNKKSSWGFAYTRYAVDAIPETRVKDNGEPWEVDDGDTFDPTITTGTTGDSPVKVWSYFDDVEENFTFSYSRKMLPKVRLGANFRVLQNSMLGTSGTGTGFDLGMLYEYSPKISLGLAVRDLFERTSYGTGSTDDVPVTLSAGAAYNAQGDMKLSLDLNKTENEDLGLRLGAEKWFQKKYAVRMGSNDGDFTAGASIKHKDWQFDYAYNAQELGDIQRMSFVRRF